MKHCLSAVSLLLFAGTSATAMIPAANQPLTRAGSTFEIKGFKPADGASVKQLSVVTMVVEMLSEDTTMIPVEDKLSAITLTKDGGEAVAALSFGEMSLDETTYDFLIPVEFPTITEAGTYTLAVPEGVVVEGEWDEDTWSFVPLEDGLVSAATTATFTVDPAAKGVLDTYILTPEPGSKVTSLDNMQIAFPDVESYAGFWQSEYGVVITATNGETTYEGSAMQDWGSEEEYKVMNLWFEDPENPDMEVTFTPGTWTVNIPSGAFVFEGASSPEIVAEYIVESMAQLTPAPGSTLNEITYFDIAFPGANKVEFVGAPYMITLTRGQLSGIPAFDVEEVEGTEVPTFRMTPIEGFAEPTVGSVLLSIEDGAFLIDGAEGETEGNSPRIQANYYYDRPISEDYQLEPNSEEVLCQSWGYTVGFVFDEVAAPRLVNPEGVVVKFDDTVLTMGSESACYEGLADYSYNTMDNILSFFIVNPEYHKEGTITVSLQGDAYTLSDKPGFDVEHSWKVVMPREYEFTLTPEGGETEENATVVNSLEEITLVFENAETAQIYQASGVSLRKTDYSVYMTADIVPVENAEHPTFKLVFNVPEGSEMTDGMYKLSIRYDTFTLDGIQTWPADYTDVERMYKLDGMSGVGSVGASESNIVTVVTTDGRVVFKNASPDSLNTLDNGIYIVNGKKVVIK